MADILWSSLPNDNNHGMLTQKSKGTPHNVLPAEQCDLLACTMIMQSQYFLKNWRIVL
jgi:hypothetical protein